MSRNRWYNLILPLLACCFLLAETAAHPAEGPRAIAAGAEPDYPPYSMVDEEGNVSGFSVDLLEAAAEEMNIDVVYEAGLWSDIKADLAEGRLDALPLVGRTPEREAVFDFTVPYLSLYGGIFVREDEREIEDLGDLEGKRVAVMKGDNAEEYLLRTDRPFELVSTPTFSDAMEMLSTGGCDAVVVQRLVGLRIIQEERFSNLRVLDDPIRDFRQDFCFAVREGDKELLALLNEGLSLIMADGTFRRLQTKWFATPELPSRTIVIGGDSDYPPFDFLNEEGEPSGFSVDLSRAIARETGLRIEIRLGPWKLIRGMLERGEIDAVLGMLYSPERDADFDFSQAHTVITNVAAARTGTVMPASPEELKGKRIAVQRNDIMHEYALEHGLETALIPVESQEEALRLVSEGEADYALVSRLTALYLIKKNGWKNLIVGKSSLLTAEYSYAVKEGNVALLAHFSEGLRILEEKGEYRRILEKWLGVYEDTAPDFGEILRMSLFFIAPLLFVLGLVMLWNWSLRRQVTRRTSALRESEKQYRLLSENTADVIWLLTPELEFRYVNSALERLTGYRPDEWTGTHFRNYIAGEQFDSAAAAITGIIEQGTDRERFTIETELSIKTGGTVPVEMSGTLLRAGNGEAEGIQGVFRDITERKQHDRAVLLSMRRKQRLNEIASQYLSRSSGASPVEKTLEALRVHFPDLDVSYCPSCRYLDAADPPFAAARVPVEGEEAGVLLLKSAVPRSWTEDETATIEEHANLLTLMLNNEKYYSMMNQANASLAASLEEKETLLKEVHHRVKNNLNVIVSLLRLQEDEIDSVEKAKQAFEESRRRIFSMALVHESLYRSENLSEIELGRYITSLVDQLLSSLDDRRNISYRFDLETVKVDIATAVPCGIILNELVTNARKHAFPDGRNGTISVSLRRRENGKAELSIRDSGKGLPAGFRIEETESLGLQLVAILSNQIDGELKVENEKGAVFTITIPESN